MNEFFLTFRRSIASLGRARIWFLILGPAAAALCVMVALALTLFDTLTGFFLAQAPWRWLAEWGAPWLAQGLAALAGWIVLLSVSYLLAVLFTALAVLPFMLELLAAEDYPELRRLGEAGFIGSAWNGISAAALFVLGWLLTLPLWLIPGMGLVLPLFWMAWLNRRTFAYDVLTTYASELEWQTLRRQKSTSFFLLGLILAALTHLPVLGLLAPALAALAYIHYGLEALRRLRLTARDVSPRTSLGVTREE